jgi:hypothetical protein
LHGDVIVEMVDAAPPGSVHAPGLDGRGPTLTTNQQDRERPSQAPPSDRGVGLGSRPVGADIAHLMDVSQDYVRHVIHAFHQQRFAVLDTKWTGGEPKTIDEPTSARIRAIGGCDPRILRQPFSARYGRRCGVQPQPVPHRPRTGDRAVRRSVLKRRRARIRCRLRPADQPTGISE